ncbi:MAG: glycosyltransferase family 2 protein [Proteobacteria bacterium]|nr:glycosyltransferase family 2 protein [Pseudomonadota bacterium]
MAGNNGSSMTVSVVVPVKDEAGNVAALAREIAAALAHEPDHEIIFVDDGSTDGTTQILTGLKDEIAGFRPLRHHRNLGQSRGIDTGVKAAKGEIIVTLDGDGQNDPADIPTLLAKLRANPALGMVSGVRVKRQDTASRRIASKLGNRFRNAMLGDGATDTGCGIKAFYRAAFLELPYFDHMHRYLIALVQRHGWKVDYAPVNHRPRLAGRSKYTNLGRTLVSIHDMLGVRWLQRRHGGATRIEEL